MRNNLPEGAQPWAKQVSKTLRADKKTLSRSEANQRAKTVQMSVGGSRLARVDSSIADVRTAEDRLSDLEGSLTGTVEGIDEVLNDPETGISTRLDAAKEAFDEFVPSVNEELLANQEAAAAAAAEAEAAKAEALAAVSRANSAVVTADEAKAAANTAQTDATTAQSAAQQAKTAADTAKATADTAASDLLTLSGKTGRVIRSTTAPTGTDQNSNNLWLNTTTGQLSEWTGSAWKVITDSRLTAATSAAASAQTKADQAFNNAGAAQERADLAKDLADAANLLAETADGKAATAQAAATAAGSSAASAQSKADTAFANAATAQSTADQAKTAASNAQTKADTAAADLLALAGKSGRLIRSATAPTSADDKNVNNLWLNTGNGQLSQWTGTAWTLITDSRLTAATNAAAAAQSTADTAKTNAATAQAKADSAFTNAATAKTAADNAMAAALGAQSTADTANAKASTADGRITIGTANPTATDAVGKPIGALWEVRSGSTVLRRFVLTGTSTWTQVKAGQDFVGDKAIGSAQIADLAVGTAQIADVAITNAKVGTLAASKIDAALGQFTTATIGALVGDQAFLERLYANRIIVGAASNLWPNGWDEYTDNRGMNNAFVYNTTGTQFPGMSNYFAVAAGTGTIYVFGNQEQVSVNPGDTYILDVWLRASNNNTRFYLEIRDQAGSLIPNSAYTVLAGPSRGSGDYALGNVTPTTSSTLWSIAIKIPAGVNTLRGLRTYFNHPNGTSRDASYAFACRLRHQTSSVLIENGAVSADKLAATLALVTRLIAGPEDGFHTELDQTGVHFHSLVDGVTGPVEMLRINTPGTDGDAGNVFALRDPLDLSSLSMSINEAGQASFQDTNAGNSLIYQGREMIDWLGDLPRGILAAYTLAEDFLFSTEWARACDASWKVSADRMMRVTFRAVFDTTSNPIQVIAIKQAGTGVVSTGTVWRSWYVAAPQSGYDGSWSISMEFPSNDVAVDADGVASIGFFVRTRSGTSRILATGSVVSATASTAIVLEDVGVAVDYRPRAGWTPLSSGSSDGAANKTQYTKTWNTAWLRTFPTNSFYAGKATQGTYNGTTFRGFLGFPNMLSDIGSADIVKIEVYVYMSHWWYNTGGTLSIQGHGQLLEPTAQPGVSGTVVSLKTAKPGGGWVTLPSTYHAGFKAGTLRGIALVGSGLAAYGYATSGQIRVTYKK